LRRGIDRWHADTRACVRVRRVLRIALTVTASEPEAAIGAIRALWNAFRTQYGKVPYFSWIELQRRGAVHYHALIVNPPWHLEREARYWLQRHWQLAQIQPDVHTEMPAWFADQAGGYVKAYAKKRGNKAYQQEYENLPRELRTFESNRLEHQVAELDEHLDKFEVVCTAGPGAPFWQQLESLWIIGHWTHTTEGRWCTLRGTCRVGRRC
jgi:hypothetical protein